MNDLSRKGAVKRLFSAPVKPPRLPCRKLRDNKLTEAHAPLQVAHVGYGWEGEVSFSEAAGVGTGVLQHGPVKEMVLGLSSELPSAAVHTHINQEQFRVGLSTHQDVLLKQEAVGLAHGLLQLTYNMC